MKRIQRIRQQGLELVGRGDKTDALTENLSQIERKVEGIRNGAQVSSKKLAASLQGSGSTPEKHQRKLPVYSVGVGMRDAGIQLCAEDPRSLFGNVLQMVGMAEQEMASQIGQYEIMLSNDVINPLAAMLEEDTKKVDKARKKLQHARLDMDSARGRLQSAERQAEKSNREYQMGKLDSLRSEVDEATKKFEDCQDAYATEMFTFMSREQLYTEKLREFVQRQISMLKQGIASLDGMLPVIDKKMKESQEKPVFGMALEEHLMLSKREVAVVISDCVEALQADWMDTEGLFRIAGSAAKVRFLKNSFNAQQRNVKGHDPHTIAGCLKRYLRELPEPLLTFDLYQDWMKAVQIQDHSTMMQQLKDLLGTLPESHNMNLKYLLAFLNEFSQYHEITKMTTSNIAIVMGPNFLRPREDAVDAAAVVSDTALQRRVTELLIEKVRWFYPDLPEIPPPTTPQHTSSYSSSYGTNPSGVYTPTAPVTYGFPPPDSPSPAASTPCSSTSSFTTEDPPTSSSHPIPQPFVSSPSQTTPPLVAAHDTVAEMRSSSPKPVAASSPPIAPKPYRGSGVHQSTSRQMSNPPSPAPRSGNANVGRPLSSEMASPTVTPPTPTAEQDDSSNGMPDDPNRPAYPTRKKRPNHESPKVGTSHSHGSVSSSDKKSLKGPSRRAPPPPTSKKPSAARQLSNEEVSLL